jgi:hypothetical protein
MVNNESSAELMALISSWHDQLTLWAGSGHLLQAAQTALKLPDDHPGLRAFVALIAAGDFTDLPPIIPLDWDAMEGSPGAYAPDRRLILINIEWLETALDEQVHAVLTEHLGHHLDVLFNPEDTPGDEGELFLECLRGRTQSEATITLFQAEEAHGVVHLDGEQVDVDEAGVGAICLDLRDLTHPSDQPKP